MAEAGRPTSCTPELTARICALLEVHGFEAPVSESLGVARSTLRRWRQRGEAGDPEFAQFAQDVAAAKARWTLAQLADIDDPKWKLERADRAEFRLPSRTELTGADGAPLVEPRPFTPEAADAIRRAILYGEDGEDPLG